MKRGSFALFGVFLFFFSILFFFKLATYNASDIGDFASKHGQDIISFDKGNIFTIKNFFPKLYLKFNFLKLKYSDEIIQSFGFIAFIFPIIFFIISIVFILKKRINYLSVRVISFTLFIFINCFLLGNLYYFNYFFEYLPGGYVGYFLSSIVNIFIYPYIAIPLALVIDLLLIYLIFFIRIKIISNKMDKKEVIDLKKSKKKSFFSFFGIFLSIKIFFELIFKIFIFLFKSLFEKKKNKELDEKLHKFEKKEINTNDKDIINLNHKNIDLTYKSPPVELISYYNSKSKKDPEFVVKEKIEKLTQTLKDFGVKGEIVNWSQGPVVTLYEFLPEAGIRASRIIGLTDDIARVMMVDAVRIFLITGKDVIGIEISNETRSFVGFREILETDIFRKTEAKIPMILGVDIFGKEIIADLSKMPHLLIAGTTGSGKSVGINCMILSLIYKLPPSQCRFIMIDPKMLEFSVYNDIPHLLMPVITDSERAIIALKWAVKEMENRYAKMSEKGVRNIEGYNESVERNDKLPYLIIFIDEMADLMIIAGKEFEVLIQRLAQMARASGIHIITATQRPSVDVLTGVIKANFPTRISYYITSKIDSRTIIGEQGAERLLGKGDMLYVPNGGKMMRVHGPFVSDAEINKICSFLRENHKTNYIDFEAVVLNVKAQEIGEDGESNGGKGGDYERAVEIVLVERKTSISYIQRKLRIGYNKAANFIEQMEEEGILSPADHTGKRRILVGDD